MLDTLKKEGCCPIKRVRKVKRLTEKCLGSAALGGSSEGYEGSPGKRRGWESFEGGNLKRGEMVRGKEGVGRGGGDKIEKVSRDRGPSVCRGPGSKNKKL